MQAVWWSKKMEFVMRSPSWIRVARSGPGWGLTKRARGRGGAGRGEKNRLPENQLPLSSSISRRSPVDTVFWLVGRHAVNQHKIYSLSRKTVKLECLLFRKPQKITAKTQHGLVTAWFETTSWLFLPRQILNFTVFKYWNCSFCISAYLCARNRCEWYV